MRISSSVHCTSYVICLQVTHNVYTCIVLPSDPSCVSTDFLLWPFSSVEYIVFQHFHYKRPKTKGNSDKMDSPLVSFAYIEGNLVSSNLSNSHTGKCCALACSSVPNRDLDYNLTKSFTVE